jgi:hypothetical protein
VSGVKRQWRQLREAEPGERFEEAHERHRIDNHAVRVFVICLGVFLLVAAAVTFWVPGPNFVGVLLGLALVATQWRFVAKRLDRLEVLGRRWHDERWEPYPHKTAVLVTGWCVGAAVVALALWFAWQHDLLPAWLPFVD